jgi:hypothetical protein
MNEQFFTPDRTAIAAHLRHLFNPRLDSLVELGWMDAATGRLNHARLFSPQDLDSIVDFAVAQNAVLGQNLYFGAALRRLDTPQDWRASDSDFFALPALYADFDKDGALEKAERECAEKGVPPTAKVVTGRHPHTRGQLWWLLQEPLSDAEACRRINRAIAAALGGDPAVINTSRVMRLGGSIAWPWKEGRITEITDFEVLSPRRYSPQEIEAIFPTAPLTITPTGPATSPQPSPGIETLLSQIGPNNWHLPMLRAVARMVACGWADPEIMAKAERHTLPGWSIEQTRSEVLAMIAGARRKGFGDASKMARLIPNISPGYTAQPLSRDEASAQLRSTISGWFDRAVPLAQARKELARRYRARFARKLPPEVAEELRTAVKEQYGISNLHDAPRLAVQAAAGLGKTMAVVHEIMARKEVWDLRVWIMVPTIDLADRLAEQFARLSCDPTLSPGPDVRVMRGRLAQAQEVRRSHDHKTMCRKPNAADAAGRLGLNVYKTICRSAAGDCEFYYHCPWIRQWQSHAPGVCIWSHEYLHLPMMSDYPPPDIIICDESVVEVLAGGLQFAPDRLTEPPAWVSGEDATNLAQCLTAIHAALAEGGPLLTAIRAKGITRAMLTKAADLTEGSEDGDTGITPEMLEAEAVERLNALAESEREKIARLLRQLAKEIDLPRVISHTVELQRNVPVLVDGKSERQNRVSVRWRRKVVIGRTRPLLGIDADADEEITRRLFGGQIEHVVISVRRNAVVTQCHTSNFSRQALLGFNGAAPDFNARAAQRLEKVKLVIRKLAKSSRLLVVCPLPVRRAITGEDAPQLPLSCEYEGATISHFGRIRGVDDWKDFDACLTIGREQPPPVAVEALARSVWDDDPVPLNLSGAYSKAPRGYRMRGGARVGVEVDIHQDPRVQRVLELKRERESLQAIDRIRLVHADDIKDVFILSKLPLDIEVDRLASFSDLLRCEGTKLEQAYRRACCGLPLSVDIIIQKWPDLYPSKKACECSIYRDLGCEKIDLLKPEIISISTLRISKPAPRLVHFGDTEALLVRWRPRSTAGKGGHRNWSRALVAADTPYFRTRVQEVMGCDVEFEYPATGLVSASAAGKATAKEVASERQGHDAVQRSNAAERTEAETALGEPKKDASDVT